MLQLALNLANNYSTLFGKKPDPGHWSRNAHGWFRDIDAISADFNWLAAFCDCMPAHLLSVKVIEPSFVLSSTKHQGHRIEESR